jgi:chromosome segregation ATPase
MAMRFPLLRVVLPVSVTLLFAAGAAAQTARPGSTSAGPSAQVMQQLQQLTAERTTLQAENSRLKADLEGARKERDSLKLAQEAVARRSRGTEGELATAAADKARIEGELATQKKRFDELVERYRETTTTMQEVETDRGRKLQDLTLREQALKVCIDHNRNLYALGTEVIGKLENQGFWSAVAKSEPFTRLKRTELENLADGYRGTAGDNLLPEAASSR